MTDKELIEIFRESCRFYKKEKEQLTKKLESGRSLEFIKKDTEFVEEMFKYIEAKNGRYARLIIYLVFVEKYPLKKLFIEFNIPQNKYRMDMKLWEETIVEGMKQYEF